MPNPFKQQWQSLKRGRPGHRFRSRYDSGQRLKNKVGLGFKLNRLCRILIALLSVAVGVVFVFIPGPAILFFFVSGGLLASESLNVARFFDWSELKIRAAVKWGRIHWHKLRLAGKIAISGLATFGVGGFAYAAYRIIGS